MVRVQSPTLTLPEGLFMDCLHHTMGKLRLGNSSRGSQLVRPERGRQVFQPASGPKCKFLSLARSASRWHSGHTSEEVG